ncbi:hypothetical protein K3U93_10615 [Mycobacterium malmoense]|uniref:DUF4878 domain-containing protein n=1 Tax=Mycobacterium malmoense TaxID=1780 RepID=A0ABX3SPD3_MYCMA|nr:hypothetical protein [Mycobacterium malmoense]ORA79091.1 hypothetical protein BST29_19750 [Mycobacterium malmoense]QZA19517.1 hypothetical protein K3U93_10615 [Mycobacterium malmoense]UNB96270.1 hypothetical protein H5T25_10605 [Mycobacterium malmoense]
MKRWWSFINGAFRTNLWRVLAFDIVPPLAAIAALVMIGVALRWPLWWVSACSVLVLLVVAGVAANVVLLRRNSVSVGTNANGPRLRLLVVAVCTVAPVAAAVVAYTHWTVPDRDLKHDSAEVVRIASAMAESASSFSPQNPTASLDRATAMMAPEHVIAFTELYNKSTAPLAERMITAEAATVSAGAEAVEPSAASVAVVMRGTRSRPDAAPVYEVIALRVKLMKNDGRWMVLDVSPIHH